MAQVVKTGIIGLGHIGKYHIRAIRSFRELSLTAACDRNGKLASLVPAGVAFYSDHRRMLEESIADTVVVATPNHTHYPIAADVLEAGKNLILEKPAAESMKELEDLERRAREKGVSICYAFHAASAFDVDWFVSYYNEPQNRAELGPVTGFACRFYDPYVENGVPEPHAEGLQDCWLDSGINAISVIQRLLDIEKMEIENVSAAINPKGKPAILQCHAGFSFPVDGTGGGGIGVIDTNWTARRNHKSTLLAFGKSGNSVRIDHSSQKVLRRYPDGRLMELADLSGGEPRLYNHYVGVFKDYLKHLETGTMNGKAAAAAHRLLFKAREAINESLDI